MTSSTDSAPAAAEGAALGGACSAPEALTAHYGSFVLRWRLLPEPEQIEIEHVQSGARARVASAARALRWMRRCLGGPDESDTAPGPAE